MVERGIRIDEQRLRVAILAAAALPQLHSLPFPSGAAGRQPRSESVTGVAPDTLRRRLSAMTAELAAESRLATRTAAEL